MKAKSILLSCLTVGLGICANAQTQPTQISIPVPSAAQQRWQEYENIMFVHFSPAAWQSREYDNWSTPLTEMQMSQLDTDQWCEVAKSWGARMVLFVAKHVGGFCWWQTNTTDYGIRNVPWKQGKGDVLKDLSESCKKYGLDLGVYIYPGDDKWGAGIGSGGVTQDPSKQEAYNEVFRTQLTEVLTQYGPMKEVWFDGNCKIPMEDILDQHAGDAVIFQSPKASLRWVGNEDGICPYPNWYTLSEADLKSGVAMALHSDKMGDAYAPVECDVPLLKNGGHKWFWAPETDSLIMTPEQLMNLYYKSVGRGSVLLLNSTPDTSGLIPRSHVQAYQKFGAEIQNRFGKPLKQTQGKGAVVTLKFENPTVVNHCILQENLSGGQRVLSYVLEASMDGNVWNTVYTGTSVGNKKIDYFPSVECKQLRARFLETKAVPDIRNFAAFYVDSSIDDVSKFNTEKPVVVATWEASSFDTDQWGDLEIDLTPYMQSIGTFELSFPLLALDFSKQNMSGLDFKDWTIEMYGKNYPQGVEFLPEKGCFRITRSQQTLDDFRTIFKTKVKSKPSKTAGEMRLTKVIF